VSVILRVSKSAGAGVFTGVNGASARAPAEGANSEMPEYSQKRWRLTVEGKATVRNGCSCQILWARNCSSPDLRTVPLFKALVNSPCLSCVCAASMEFVADSKVVRKGKSMGLRFDSHDIVNQCGIPYFQSITLKNFKTEICSRWVIHGLCLFYRSNFCESIVNRLFRRTLRPMLNQFGRSIR
jgi:hypothetical protein